MARGKSGSKSQAISEYLSTNKDASPNQIVEALKAMGIEVSLGLAKVVKYRKKAKKAPRKRPTVVAASNGKPMTGSESIRQYIAKHPAAGPKAIEHGLKQKGVKVSLALISAVKYAKGSKTGKKRRSKTPVVHAAARKTSSAITIEHLLEVKRLTDSVGGADLVRRALDTLEQLR